MAEAETEAQAPVAVTDWRVHLGAHKTATTHLQGALAAKKGQLRRAGVEYLPLHRMRQAKVQELRKRLDAEGVRGPARRAALTEALLPKGPRCATVALSDENLIGIPMTLLRQGLYPRAHRMVKFLSRLGGDGATLRFYLATRSLDTLLPSTYAEATRRRHLEGGFDAVRRRILSDPPRWSRLVADIRKAAPEAKLRVWRYEDYPSRARKVAELFLGVDPGDLDEGKRPGGTATPSARAVAEAEALPPELSVDERWARTSKIYGAHPATGRDDKYNPLTEEERAALRADYDADLARLEAEHPGVMMRWD